MPRQYDVYNQIPLSLHCLRQDAHPLQHFGGIITNTDVKNWFSEKMASDQQLDFLLFVYQSWDSLLAVFSAAGQNFTTHAAIESSDVSSINKDDYQTALYAAVEDLQEAKTAYRRMKPMKAEPTLRPVNPTRAPKKPGLSDEPGGPTPLAGAPGQGAPPRKQGITGSGSWDNSWGSRESGNAAWENSKGC